MPIILVISFIYINFTIGINNETLIINQYLNRRLKSLITLALCIFITSIYFFNNEIVSPSLYKLYKSKEIDIRNNLKLGVPSNKEFHIENELSLFYEKHEGNYFYDIEAIIFEDNQFIQSREASIEYNNRGFNIVFFNGFRVKMNKNEKSKTEFEKFEYNIEKDDLEEILFDKEHYNTFELLKHEEKDYVYHGHNRIYQYILLILILLSSIKIILAHKKNKQKIIADATLFSFMILVYLINSLLLNRLNNYNLSIWAYYFINILVLASVFSLISKIYDYK